MASLKLTKKFGNPVEQAHNFRVAVFGQTGVGKTALIVRFVTEKFIGEYDPNLEMIYQRMFLSSPTSDVVFFEIIDTLEQKKDEDPEILQEKIKWADAFVLVFSVTDQKSFKNLICLRNLIWNTINGNVCCEQVNQELPLVVVGNKNDLQFQRTVSAEEGSKLAAKYKCPYFEISVRESVEEVTEVFTALYESHRKILKSGGGRKRCDYGPHIDLPMMPHHFPLLSNLHRHRSFKYLDKIQRMQGLAGANILLQKQLKQRGTIKPPLKRSSYRKKYDERKESAATIYERHLEDFKYSKSNTLSVAQTKFPFNNANEESSLSPYDNSTDEELNCDHVKRWSFKHR